MYKFELGRPFGIGDSWSPSSLAQSRLRRPGRLVSICRSLLLSDGSVESPHRGIASFFFLLLSSSPKPEKAMQTWGSSHCYRDIPHPSPARQTDMATWSFLHLPPTTGGSAPATSLLHGGQQPATTQQRTHIHVHNTTRPCRSDASPKFDAHGDVAALKCGPSALVFPGHATHNQS